MRGAKNSRANSHSGAFGVFRSVGLPQRTLGGVEGISGTRASAGEVSAVRDADDGAQSFVCKASKDKFHRGAFGVSRKRSGAAGKTFRFESECVCGHSGGAGGAGAAAVFGARFS